MKIIRWRVFLLSLVCQFIITSLVTLGIRPPQLVGGAESKVDLMEDIKPKLEERKDSFSLEDREFIPTALAAGDFNLAASYIAVDFDSGKVLAEKNSSKQIPIASLSKIMTAVVSLDLAHSEDLFIVSKKASEIEPTKMGLIPGQSWSVEELLHGLLLTSSNDAAQVLMEGVDQKYNKDIFITSMNEKARIIGLKSCHFENPQGFDGDVCSSSDMAILTHYALTNYPLINTIVQKDYQFFPETETHKQADLYNWNGLLGVYPGVMGVKIGNTSAAKYTTIVLSKRGDRKVLAVLLGAPGVLQRDLWTAQLLDSSFEALGQDPVNVTEEELKQKYATWKYFN
jgi:serine-type D-Ala-D-Ala carboxypeptidase (penicillin-binding protein 5/6)